MTERSGQPRQSRYKNELLKQGPLRILFLEDTKHSAEQLVSYLRNDGLATRVHRITSPQDLEESLHGQSWDMLIAFDDAEAMPPRDAVSTIFRTDKDLPALLLQEKDDSDSVIEWLSLGGADAIPSQQPDRFQLVCMREWYNLCQRRQRRANEIALNDAEKRCELLLESSVDAIAYVHEGMHVHANAAYVELFGYGEPDDLAGLSLIDIIHRDDQGNFKQFFRKFKQGSGTEAKLDFKGQRDDSQDFQASMTLSSAKWDDEKCTQVVIRKAAADPELEKKLEAMKSTDLTTGLYNRSFFTTQLDSALEKHTLGNGNFAVLDIRLDKFQDLKRELGVANADQYLAEVAGLLTPLINDHGLLARYGDDIFVALVKTNVHSRLQELAQSAVSTIKSFSTKIGGTVVETTASIGIMPITESADSANYVLSRAEDASLAASKSGGNQAQLHNQQAELEAMAKEGDIVALVTQALDQDRFRLSYQPVINLEDEQEQQYEVYSRLISSTGEAVPASEFITASKRAGLTTRIDRWAILHAIKNLSEHRDKGHDTRLFITLGPESMQDPTLPSWMNVALKALKIPGNALILQMAEEDLALCVKPASAICANLKKIHCGICITHFGGATDPFAILSRIPADFVKIDGSLISKLDEDQEVLTRLQEMTSMLNQKNVQVMIPKVESGKVLSTLWQCDVNYVQGYFLQPPMETMTYDFQ